MRKIFNNFISLVDNNRLESVAIFSVTVCFILVLDHMVRPEKPAENPGTVTLAYYGANTSTHEPPPYNFNQVVQPPKGELFVADLTLSKNDCAVASLYVKESCTGIASASSCSMEFSGEACRYKGPARKDTQGFIFIPGLCQVKSYQQTSYGDYMASNGCLDVPVKPSSFLKLNN